MPTKPGSRERVYKPTFKVFTKMQGRERSRDEYHTARWTRESAAFRKANPLCKRCKDAGRISPTNVTDHIVPVAIHGDFYDRSNWQPLCRKCNIAKGNEDKQLIKKYNEQR